MANRFLLASKLTCLIIFAAIVQGSLPHMHDGDVIAYTTITGEAEKNLNLSEGPHLLPLAAKTGTNIHVAIDQSQQTAIVQEGVHVSLDCLPWLNKFFNATAMWTSNSAWFRNFVYNSEHVAMQLLARLFNH